MVSVGSVGMTSVNNTAWVQTFDLTNRIGTPDLCSPVRYFWFSSCRFYACSLSSEKFQGFLACCDIPTIAFAMSEELDRQEIARLHKALWNQGLTSLLCGPCAF